MEANQMYKDWKPGDRTFFGEDSSVQGTYVSEPEVAENGRGPILTKPVVVVIAIIVFGVKFWPW